MHRIDLTSVYVLHTRPYSNTSLIVELFSKQYGRITAIARSARGPKSRYRGQLQLFTPMLAAWSGRHELKMLGNIELNGMPLQLNQTPLFCGFYFNELLMRLLHKEDPHPNLFDYYYHSLFHLEKGDSVPIALRLFEKKLLEELGYGLPFLYEAKTHEPIHSTVYYRYEHQHGFIPTNISQGDSGLFLGADLIAIAAEKWECDAVLLCAKRLMRLALSFILGHKPLNSRALFSGIPRDF